MDPAFSVHSVANRHAHLISSKGQADEARVITATSMANSGLHGDLAAGTPISTSVRLRESKQLDRHRHRFRVGLGYVFMLCVETHYNLVLYWLQSY